MKQDLHITVPQNSSNQVVEVHRGRVVKKQLLAGEIDIFPDIYVESVARESAQEVVNVDKLSINEVRYMLRRKGLPASGGRLDLVQRLKQANSRGL